MLNLPLKNTRTCLTPLLLDEGFNKFAITLHQQMLVRKRWFWLHNSLKGPGGAKQGLCRLYNIHTTFDRFVPAVHFLIIAIVEDGVTLPTVTDLTLSVWVVHTRCCLAQVGGAYLFYAQRATSRYGCTEQRELSSYIFPWKHIFLLFLATNHFLCMCKFKMTFTYEELLQNDFHPLWLILKNVTFLRIYGQLFSTDCSKSISIKSARKTFCK